MTEELESLFDQWRKHLGPGTRFVADGVVGTDAEYLSSPKKLLFLLKETHDRNGVMSACDFDLRRLVRDSRDFKQNRKTMENTIARWAVDYWKAFSPKCTVPEKPIRSVAIVNLKKTSGEARAYPRLIREAVVRDREYLRRQIEILDPEVIICGSTFVHLAKLYPDAQFRACDSLVVQYGSRLFLDSHHPTARGTKLTRHRAVLAALLRYCSATS